MRGGRLSLSTFSGNRCGYFNPRPPRGGRPETPRAYNVKWIFQPTPSSRRTTVTVKALQQGRRISTHALLAEGDHPVFQRVTPARFYFNPRPPRGGRRAALVRKSFWAEISTHALLAEGDGSRFRIGYTSPRISTHALLAEGDSASALFQLNVSDISTHALLAEGDRNMDAIVRYHDNFNPRPPRGGRPLPSCRGPSASWISTHALLAEGDAGGG